MHLHFLGYENEALTQGHVVSFKYLLRDLANANAMKKNVIAFFAFCFIHELCCVCGERGYTVFTLYIHPHIRPSIMFRFLLIILLNDLSEGSHYLTGVSNKHCLSTFLVTFKNCM